jgi:putative flippase GtrA
MKAPSWPGDARSFATFLVSGGIGALVNIFCRIALNQIMPFSVAVVFAYPAGMITAYLLMKFLVFARRDRPVVHEFTRFALVNVVSFTQVWCVSMLLAAIVFPAVGFTWHAETLAHITGVVSPAVTSYLLHSSYTFGK